MNGPDYLQSPRVELWGFDALGEAVEWSQGSSQLGNQTIALTAELAQILKCLVRDLGGLPELTAILFLIAASRENSDPRWLSRQVEMLRAFGGTIATAHTGGTTEFADDSDHRQRVMNLCFDLREIRRQGCHDLGRNFLSLFGPPLTNLLVIDQKGAEHAIALLQMPQAERPSTNDAANLSLNESFVVDGVSSNNRSLHQTWICLDKISRVPIDLDAAILKLKVGVEEIPDATEIDPIEDDCFAGLITKLRADQEFGEIAKSAYHVASVLSLPLAPSEPSELPIGGVSDITNRGNPERLLATELAADPMMLLARIANGQALYLRRESPPDRGRRARQILIENSVRTWGQTRVQLLAVSLGLASSEQARGQSDVDIGTLAGDDFVNEDFSSRAGIVDHLGRLAATAHPGIALLQWADQQNDVHAERELPVLVLSLATWKDQDFQVAIRELDRQLLVATVDHRGEVHLFRSDETGVHSLRRIRLDRLRFGEPQAGQSRGPTLSSPDDVPAFVRQSVPPLRFGLNSPPTWCAASLKRFWVASPDDRLLCFDAEGSGAVSVLDRFSSRSINAQLAVDDSLQLVVTLGNEFHYLAIHAVEGLTVNRKIKMPPDSEFFFDCGSLFARKGKMLYLIDKNTGGTLDQIEYEGIQVLGRPFSYDQISGVEVYHQAGDRIESHSFPGQKIDPPAIAFRDKNNVPTFVSSGMMRIISLDPDRSDRMITGRFSGECRMTKLRGVSAACDKVIVGGSMRQETKGRASVVAVNYCVDLESANAVRVYPGESPKDMLRALSEPASEKFRQLNSLTRIVGAGVDSKGLFLMPRRGRIPKRLMIEKELIFQREASVSLESAGRFGDAIYVDALPERAAGRVGKLQVGWKLRKLSLGHAVLWLDSRGLLHLASSSDARQMTLVLNTEKVAGWLSDGDVFGDPYFHHHVPVSTEFPKRARDWYESWLLDARWAKR